MTAILSKSFAGLYGTGGFLTSVLLLNFPNCIVPLRFGLSAGMPFSPLFLIKSFFDKG
jgi:hypothetical protein